jgi:predicted MPP superfamily phosphohydrolase
MRKAFIKSLDFVANKFNALVNPWLPEFNGTEITRLFVQLPYLDPVFNGYRLVQFSDIHLGTLVQEVHLNEVVDLVNELEPDTIAITGDFVSHQPEEFAFPLLSALKRLIAKDVKVAVLGNHDHWTSAESIRWVLKRSSIIELRNSVLPLHREQKSLYLAGVDDFLVNKDQI